MGDSGGEGEDMFANPFFALLRSKFPDLYATAEKELYTICIPQVSSLPRDIKTWATASVVGSHILKPSPFFAGVYTVHNDTMREVDLEGSRLVTRKNFLPPPPTSPGTAGGASPTGATVAATVLFDELFYNKQGKAFRVLCLDRPLLPTSADSAARSPSSPGSQPTETVNLSASGRSDGQSLGQQMGLVKSLAQSEEFLSSFPENVFVMRKVRSSQIQTFLDSSLRGGNIPRGEELGPVAGLRGVIEFCLDQLMCANIDFRKLNALPSHLRQLELIIEIWVVGAVHSALFEGLARNFADEDERLLHKMLACQGVSLGQLGIRGQIAEGLEALDFAPAVGLIQDRRHGFDSPTATPLEKLYLLRQIFATVTQAVVLAQQRRQLFDALRPAQAPRGVAAEPSPSSSDSIFALTAPALDSPGNMGGSGRSAGGSEDAAITSDDLIPLVTYLLILAKPRHLQTALYTMHNYVFVNLSTSELGFNLVTLSAAAEYLKRDQRDAPAGPGGSGGREGLVRVNSLSNVTLLSKPTRRSVTLGPNFSLPTPSGGGSNDSLGDSAGHRRVPSGLSNSALSNPSLSSAPGTTGRTLTRRTSALGATGPSVSITPGNSAHSSGHSSGYPGSSGHSGYYSSAPGSGSLSSPGFGPSPGSSHPSSALSGPSHGPGRSNPGAFGGPSPDVIDLLRPSPYAHAPSSIASRPGSGSTGGSGAGGPDFLSHLKSLGNDSQ